MARINDLETLSGEMHSRRYMMKRIIFGMAAALLAGIIVISFGMGCNMGSSGTEPVDDDEEIPDTTLPYVVSIFPEDNSTGMSINRSMSVVFSEEMSPATISIANITMMNGTMIVAGQVTYEGTTATFAPELELEANTVYTGTVKTSVMDLAGNALASEKEWTFTTGTTISAGPMPISLGTAGNFVILTKSGIDTVPGSTVTGDIGVSPAAATYMTGFSLYMDASNEFSTSAQLVGKAYSADYSPPTPAKMTTAISDMEIAYTNAAGRSSPDFTELSAGDISGLTLVPGLYKWGTGLMIATDITLKGGANDVWIFQVSGDLTLASGVKMILSGGAIPKNIFWQSYGAVILNTTSHLEGTVLSQTEITLATGASVNGRLLSQTAVTIDQSTVTKP